MRIRQNSLIFEGHAFTQNHVFVGRDEMLFLHYDTYLKEKHGFKRL